MKRMDTVDSLLLQLEQYGEEHDRNKKTREEKLRNVSREMGQFLSILVKGCNAKNILEIGTSNGYSTLWLANAVEETNGNVTTVELSSERVGEALVNFEKANLLQRIDIHNQEAGAFLDSQLDHSFDFIFLDSERTQYMWWLEHIKRILQPQGLLVVDNATSHASELVEFIKMIEEDEMFETVLLAFQKGAFVARKKK
ncbi:O-methyltransferase [Bacillus thuringiensis]|uniref:O-methyltransferase n=1 Tax=Bacillus thuringiensis TaxID=1428 RepID=UPI000A384C33|nr:class I SAM-dependent methyltransferase [Bacillus thuringiensis]MCU4721802.1 class I SAM-dependent methyltransferase [Bacillus cereus]MBG9748524.1 methyltransferase [Bacillus thuringiensis]MBG9779292.1 methyltransferase [Bacillus thuringiensis]MDC7732153.1 class I SAM-dependent methyltransferase [Bacillus thuringiensis]OTZ86419.1 methyltransferase [Bacillus thuringiensis serovar ostriniae]